MAQIVALGQHCEKVMDENKVFTEVLRPILLTLILSDTQNIPNMRFSLHKMTFKLGVEVK